MQLRVAVLAETSAAAVRRQEYISIQRVYSLAVVDE